MINESSVFEPLKFDCRHVFVIVSGVNNLNLCLAIATFLELRLILGVSNECPQHMFYRESKGNVCLDSPLLWSYISYGIFTIQHLK